MLVFNRATTAVSAQPQPVGGTDPRQSDCGTSNNQSPVTVNSYDTLSPLQQVGPSNKKEPLGETSVASYV